MTPSFKSQSTLRTKGSWPEQGRYERGSIRSWPSSFHRRRLAPKLVPLPELFGAVHVRLGDPPRLDGFGAPCLAWANTDVRAARLLVLRQLVRRMVQG